MFLGASIQERLVMGSTSCLPWKLVFSGIFAIAGLCFFACSAKHHVFHIKARTGSTHVPALNSSYGVSCAWIHASSEECRPHDGLQKPSRCPRKLLSAMARYQPIPLTLSALQQKSGSSNEQ